MIFHCLRGRFYRRISSCVPAGIVGRGSRRGRRLRVDAARAFRTAPEKFSTHVSITISLCVQFRIERNYLFQLSLEVGPVRAPEVRTIRLVVKGLATRSVNENREVVRASCGARSQIHRE